MNVTTFPSVPCRRAVRSGLVLGAMLLAAWLVLPAALAATATPEGKAARRAARPQTPPPTKPPLQEVDITRLPEGQKRIDLYLLLGQSNMKGRGFMPEEPSRDPRIVMLHVKDDRWYVARHPLHLTGDARTFQGADNAGVGPGLAFAAARLARDPTARIGLVPGAVGGSSIGLWAKGARLYEEALRRARLALAQTQAAGGTIRAVLWLQGEADATEKGLPQHEARLGQLIDAWRADLGQPTLPFIACTIGEMAPAGADPARGQGKAAMNALLLRLPTLRPHTACVDARDLVTHIGDFVHFDTAAQEEIGRRYAAQLVRLQAE